MDIRAGRRVAQSVEQPIVVHPNSDERWDPEARCWTGTVGCCRIRPGHIREVAEITP